MNNWISRDSVAQLKDQWTFTLCYLWCYTVLPWLRQFVICWYLHSKLFSIKKNNERKDKKKILERMSCIGCNNLLFFIYGILFMLDMCLQNFSATVLYPSQWNENSKLSGYAKPIKFESVVWWILNHWWFCLGKVVGVLPASSKWWGSQKLTAQSVSASLFRKRIVTG